MTPPWEEELVRHEAFLMRLARRLVGNEAAAEDLVQDAFVKALERPPMRREALRAWLATVLRRNAGRVARTGRRRSHREADSARSEQTGGGLAGIDAQLDAHANLLAHLQRLPEGERQALFLRYSEELTPSEIATRLGLPLDTVKTRLRRGRERLRTHLDQRYGDRSSWAAIFLQVPAAGVVSTATTTTIPTLIGKGILMGTGMKVGAAVAAGAVAVWWVGTRDAERVDANAVTTETVAVEEVLEEVVTFSATDEPTRGEVIAEEPLLEIDPFPGSIIIDFEMLTGDPIALPEVAEWPLRVRAMGDVIAGAEVEVNARLNAWGRGSAEKLTGELGADGFAMFDVGPQLAQLMSQADGARAEELIVTIHHPDLVSSEANVILPDPLDLMAPPAEPLEALVMLERAAIVVGRLVSADDGLPFDNAVVQSHFLRDGLPTKTENGFVEPKEDGTFRLKVDGDGSHALLFVGGWHRPKTLRRALARGRIEDLGDIKLDRGLAIDGMTLSATGVPEAEANAFAALTDPSLLVELATFSFELPGTFDWRDGAFELYASMTKSDQDGRFRIEGLGPREYSLDSHAPGWEVPFTLPDQLRATAPARVELRPQAALLRIHLLFPDGVGLDGSGSWVRGDPNQQFTPVESRDFSLHAWQFQESHELGYALPPGEHVELTLNFTGMRPVTLPIDTPEVGGLLEPEVELEPDQAMARVVLELRGREFPDGASFNVARIVDDQRKDEVLKLSDGRLTVMDLKPGQVELRVSMGSDHLTPQDHLCESKVSLELHPGEERFVPIAFEIGGTLILEAHGPDGERVSSRVDVTAPDGTELDLVFVARIPHGRAAAHNHLFTEGPSRAVPDLPPGRYHVTVKAGGYATVEVDVDVVAGRTIERIIELTQ